MSEKTKIDCGLVLEGGGMRGIYTAGVLDAWMDYDVWFSYVIGTSAGATSGISYLSRQKGRTRFCDVDLLKIHNYINMRSFIAGRGIIDMDYLFKTFPDDIYPFDFAAYKESGARAIMVASDAETGKAVYLENYDDIEKFTKMARASCSLPIMCPMGNVEGRWMVDGGVSDSIPFEKALADGCERVVVVLTKEVGYRKEAGVKKLPSFIYRKYPALRDALSRRNDEYNAQLDRLEKAVRDGRAMVIQPQDGCGVGRTTDDIAKLDALYDHGYGMAIENIEKVRDFALGR
ncbi:MAG: patatin family protein [Bacteroidales bacterium]|nr:patatin family protein [Bacteroidales bacterium]